MRFISCLDPEARTTIDGHAKPAVDTAMRLILDALDDPSKAPQAEENVLARIIVESLAEGTNKDLTQAFSAISLNG